MVSVEKPFADWIGRRSASEDIVTQRVVDSYRAIMEPFLVRAGDGDAPLGIHWALSPAIEPMAALGPDGHPAKNLSLPPVPLPRRMWAGGSLELISPIKIGDHVHRISTIADVVHKTGRSGELWFVTVDHDYLTPRGLAIRERQDIVYRQAAGQTKTQPIADALIAPRHSTRTWTIETPSTLLFRYSAITFNGHRIHYDLPYATGVEGYRGLVVHGPLQATMLLNLAASDNRQLRRFDYRGVAPAIAGNALTICADDATGELWTAGPNGTIHMEGTASY